MVRRGQGKHQWASEELEGDGHEPALYCKDGHDEGRIPHLLLLRKPMQLLVRNNREAGAGGGLRSCLSPAEM